MSFNARANVLGGLFVLLGSVASTSAVDLAAQDTRPGVGVLPFNNGGSFGQDAKDYDALRVGLQQILITELSQNSGVRLVERARLRDLMAEQDIPADRVNPETAARIGRLVGARYMIIGGFIDWYGDVRLDARIVDTETTDVLDADRVEGEVAELLSLTVDLAMRISNKADLPPLTQEARDRQQPQDVPPEALAMFSQAMLSRDLGRDEESDRMLRQLTEDFPNFIQARVALERGVS